MDMDSIDSWEQFANYLKSNTFHKDTEWKMLGFSFVLLSCITILGIITHNILIILLGSLLSVITFFSSVIIQNIIYNKFMYITYIGPKEIMESLDEDDIY